MISEALELREDDGEVGHSHCYGWLSWGRDGGGGDMHAG